MRILLLTICLAVLVVPATSRAQGTLHLAGGGNEESYTLEFGGTTRQRLLALGASYFEDADRHLQLGEEQNTFAVYAKYGIEVVKDSGLFVNAIGGVCFVDERRLDHYYTDANEPPEGRFIEFEETDEQVHFLYGAGLSYFPPDSNLMLFVDYDNQRKVTGGIGWCWKY